MPTTLNLKPAETTKGKPLLVPNPATGLPLPAAGETVDDSPYWRRRLREKSVELLSDEALAASKAKADAEKTAQQNAENVKEQRVADTSASAEADTVEAAQPETPKKSGKAKSPAKGN